QGLTPFHYICVTAAATLSELESLSDIFTFWVILKLAFIGSFLLLVTIYKTQIFDWIKSLKFFKRTYLPVHA
ncbi:MAG: hypothetical protein RL059_749, partial [Bacteroidota bacterium]